MSLEERRTSRKRTIFIMALLVAGTMTSTRAGAGEPGEVAAAAAARQGVDLQRFRAVAEDVRRNPAHGRLEFRADGESEEMLYHSTARIGPFKVGGQELGRQREHLLHLGLPVELQPEAIAPVDRIEPLELALAGLADCVIGTVRVHALANGIELERVTATIRAPVDIQVLLGLQDLDQRDEMYGKISIEVELEGPGLTEADRALLAENAKRSVVFNLVALAHDAEPQVRVSSGSRRADP